MQNNEPLPDFQQEQAAPQPIRIRFPLIQPNMAYAIIFVLVLVHLYVSQLNPFEQNDFYLKYSNFAVYVAQGEYYRLFTSMFLHAPGLMHLGFNSLALYAFGKDIESLFGHVRFTLIYFLGGLAGSVTSFAITRSNSIGASGAVFAVFGALVAYYYQNRQLYGAAAAVRLRQLGMLALVNLGIGLFTTVPGSPVRIDNAAHIGGALGGLVLAWYITPIFRVQWGFEDDGEFAPHVVDTRAFSQWVYAPAVFSILMVIVSVLLVNSRTG